MEPRSPEGVLLTEIQYKRFVKVRADHMLDGKTLPLKFRTEDGPEIKIDRITDVRRAAATKAGGQGIRYTCIVCGHEVYLFHDRDMWFVEINAQDGALSIESLSRSHHA